MRLTKLEVHGFKAFADRTEFLFEPGVTAIVGPNGSGKSNVSDAVRWVLGEQRARAMRGAKMEDVIFHGSSARRAVNMAEVSLHFENNDGDLPVPFKEVVITRRLLRSGDSEYLLNRAPCRLRDIQDLVRGTGLGADSGVVIESKMIDALLSDRPDERRELFEEAAGVGLYRDRRRSAERRLEETTTDLARLDDLIAEVQSQTRSLARQRKRAERHAELVARRFTVELSLATRETAAWREELAALDDRLVTVRAELPAAEERITAAMSSRERAVDARATAEGARGELARLAGEQREHTALLERELAVAEERQRNTAHRRQRAEAEREENEAFGRRLADDRERAASERSAFQAELAVAGDELQQRIEAEAITRESMQRLRVSLEAMERQTREHRDQARRVEIDRESAERDRTETTHRLELLHVERESLAEALAEAERAITRADENVELAATAVAESATALEGARLAATDARVADGETRVALAAAIEARTSVEGRMNALETLERERVGLAPAAARLLRERDRFAGDAVLGPLTDFLSADGDSARMIERYLGVTVHAIVVRDAAAAAEVQAWHADTQPGPLLLLPLDLVRDVPPEPDSLLARVDAAGPAESWVRALLGHVQVFREGQGFVDERGAVFLPGSGGGAGSLQRRAEIARLERDLADAERARASAAADAEAARGALEEAERVQQSAAEQANRALADARRADELRAELRRQRERAERELAQSTALAERLLSRATELEARVGSLTDRAGALHARAGESESAIVEARDALSTAERDQDAAREERAMWQVSQAQAQARLSVAVDRERRLAEEDTTAVARLESLAKELTTLSDADRTLLEQLSAGHADLDAQRKTLADAEERLAVAEREVRAASAALTEADELLNGARSDATALADALHAAQLRHAELSGRREAIRQRLETEWRRSMEELLDGFTPLDEETESLRAEAGQLRQSLDELGPVNPLAIEEHEEEHRRLEFLTAQRNDLVSAKQSLHQAIREIDSTARELFLVTFSQTRDNFRQIFLTLFGGGECDLRLENPDAPLDCDIEIHASPRGKKTQRINLLSSGERALVALSLLFGIFLTKPSPFCLLDEVDAPLDDQNIGRFVTMLNRFKAGTQFIVITHNPRTTTEAADSVYGVTMQEPGVSSIVSVRLRGRTIDGDRNGNGPLGGERDGDRATSSSAANEHGDGSGADARDTDDEATAPPDAMTLDELLPEAASRS